MSNQYNIANILDGAATLLSAAAAAVRSATREVSELRDQAQWMQEEIELLQGYREDARKEDLRSAAELLREDDAPAAPKVDLMATSWGKVLQANLAATRSVPPPPPAADIPPLDAAPAPGPGPSTGARTRRGRGAKKGEGEGQTLSPDAVTDEQAREQVAQVLGDAPRDVSADLFGGHVADSDDFLPL